MGESQALFRSSCHTEGKSQGKRLFVISYGFILSLALTLIAFSFPAINPTYGHFIYWA